MMYGKELAERLGVSSATLSQATSEAHLCRGHNVSAWAVRSPNGRVIGYEVPVYVAATLRPPLPLVRVNPSPSGDGQSKEASPPPFGVLSSVLPPSGDGPSKEASPPPVGEVAPASAAPVVTKALERDTPSGSMTTTVAVALLGAGLSLLIAGLMYRPQGEPLSWQPVLQRPAPQEAVIAPTRPRAALWIASTR